MQYRKVPPPTQLTGAARLEGRDEEIWDSAMCLLALTELEATNRHVAVGTRVEMDGGNLLGGLGEE
jgi:hypothetical protein